MMLASCSSTLDTVLTLPSDTGALAIARACRETALAFVNESKHWGKAELAMWLMGPYQQVTRFDEAYALHKGRAPSSSRTPRLREIDSRMVDRIISSARLEVAAAIDSTRDPELAASFAFTMLSAGFIVPCQDVHGGSGWMPSSSASRLADRVLSLFATDYFVRPTDYEHALEVCRVCAHISIDSEGQGCICEGRYQQPYDSLIVSRRQTLPYLPEGA